jgi:D-lactate dehydrogenase
MIDENALNKMKQEVMIINTSRGALIDTKALVQGLKSGKIGSAGLDVYEEEASIFFHDKSGEVITDDVFARLTTFNNVVITSHQGFLTKEALSNIAQTTLENFAEFIEGKRGDELTCVVSD